MPGNTKLTPLLDAAQANALLAKVYPQLNGESADYEAVDVFPGGCIVRLKATERHLRPGGTVSGPSLFTLADIGGYVCVLSHAGLDALSVTTNLSIQLHAQGRSRADRRPLPYIEAGKESYGV